MKKGSLLIWLIVIVIAAGAAVYTHMTGQWTMDDVKKMIQEGISWREKKASPSQTDKGQTRQVVVHGEVVELTGETNSRISSADETVKADKRLVGKWGGIDENQRFRVYYSDPCDQPGFFWGKEWNENEEVYEEDLLFHGNGWFMWRVTKKEMLEVHIGDQKSLQVPIALYIDTLTEERLIMHNETLKFRFKRIE